MDKKYICYCGGYCENCAVMAKVSPASKVLYEEMRKARFEDFIHSIPGGDGFWSFLKSMAEDGVCVSCKAGSGNPDCAVRHCAKERGVWVCTECGDYPCERFNPFFAVCPVLQSDNALLQGKDMDAWAKLQDERRAEGFTYQDGLSS